MTVPVWKELSDAEQNELPCVVCGNPFGIPAGGSYWICPYCWWEECDHSFRTAWIGGGPNRFSLWQSRRLYEFAGISCGPFLGTGLEPKHPPSVDRYDWDIDPKFYSDCAISSSNFDPVSDTLNVLRCYGLFSARQIKQKLVKRREIFKPGETYQFPHSSVQIVDIPRSLRARPFEAVVGVQSVIVELSTLDQDKLMQHEFAKRLSNLTPDKLAESEFRFQIDKEDSNLFRCTVGKDSEANGNTYACIGDPNEYWISVEFRNDQFSRLIFRADENGSKPFIELDHDKEIIRNASNA